MKGGTDMDQVNRWVFTICCGTLLCGVVSILAPGKGTERLLRTVLGLFMLCCFLLPAGLELELPELELPEASSAMEEAAGEITGYFLEDTVSRSREELHRLAAKELLEYGINEKDIQIYIEADGPREGSGPALAVELVLPERLRDRQEEFLPGLEQALGIAVRLEYRREEP